MADSAADSTTIYLSHRHRKQPDPAQHRPEPPAGEIALPPRFCCHAGERFALFSAPERRWHMATARFLAPAALLLLSVAELGTIPSMALFAAAIASLLTFLQSFLDHALSLPQRFRGGCFYRHDQLCGGTIKGGFAGPALLGYLVVCTNSFRSGFAFLLSGIELLVS